MKKLILLFTIFTFCFQLLTLNCSAQWQQTSLTHNKYVSSFAMTGNNIFAGTWCCYGVFLSTDYGSSWIAVNDTATLKPSYNIMSLAVNVNNIFVGTDHGIFLSSDNGSTWDSINTGLPPHTYVDALAIKGDTIFAGTLGNGVFMSSNNGNNWVAVNTGITAYGLYVESFAVCGNYFFTGTQNGVYVSSNNGSSWNLVSNGLSYDYMSNTFPQINALAINGSVIFAGTNRSGVYISLNNGSNWAAVNNSGITDSTGVSSFAIKGDTVFAGTWFTGVFWSSNNGITWDSLNYGFPYNLDNVEYPNINALAINGDYIFAGTESNGVFRLPLSEVGIKEINNNESDMSIYPNPVTNTLAIDIPKAAVSDIAVYNLLGEEVYATTNYKPLTTDKIDVSSFPAGMYVVQVKTENGVEVRKFVKE